MQSDSLLFERHPNPMLIYDVDTLNVLKVNDAAVQKYGYSAEEFESLSLEDLWPEEDVHVFHEVIDTIEGGMSETRVIRHQAKDGTQFFVQVNSNKFPYRDYNSRLVVISDISKEVESRIEAEETYRELDQFIRNNPLAMIKLDNQLRVIEWSGRAEEISGYSQEEMAGKSLLETELFRPDTREKISDRLSVLESEQEPEGLDIFIVTKSGNIIDIRLHTSVLRKRDGSIRSIMILVENISETKEAERKLRRKNELFEFINNLSHSINYMETYDEALELTIMEICKFIDWPVGHAYKLDAENNLKNPNIWYTDPDEELESIVRQLNEASNVNEKGIIGSIVGKGEPVWLKGIGKKAQFLRTPDSGETSLKTCFAFPVEIDDNTSVILEFFHTKIVESDQLLMDFVETIENQLSRVLERTRTHEELQFSEQKFRRLFEQANDGIFILKGKEIVDCNRRAEEMFKCGRKEIIGETPFTFSPDLQPDGSRSKKRGEAYIQKVQNGIPQTFQWKHITKQGELIDTEVSLSRLKLEDGDYLQGIVHDITEQKQAERALRKSEELFRNLFLRAPVAIAMVNENNQVKMVNRQFEQLFGYSEEELLNEALDSKIVRDSDLEKAPQMSSAGTLGEHYIKEFQRVTKSGREIDVLVGAIPVYMEGEPLAGFGIYIDITDQKESQRKLERSVKEKEILLKEIHHRVKNNLAVISALLQLQAFKSTGDQTVESEILNDSLMRIKSMALVHETLYQTEDFANLRFSDYVENLMQYNTKAMESGDKKILFDYDIEDLALNINQAVPLALILNEMVSNALKYAFEGRKKGKVEIRIFEEDTVVHLSVEDDGIGLPENFEEMREDSLGMTLIDLLVTQLHGDLNITSNGGSRFNLKFRKEAKSGSSGHFFP